MFDYDRAIYKTINDEIQLCLIMIELYIKQLMMKYNFALIMIELYINNRWWNTTLFNDDIAIYKTINDEIQLCLIMIELYIKQ